MIEDAFAALCLASPVLYAWTRRGHMMAPVISVADDDTSFRRATARLIHSLGHTVVSFSSAEEFLASGRAERLIAAVVAGCRVPVLA
jgi:FixJ family two-component response regulator